MRHYYTLGDNRYLPQLHTLLDSVRKNFKEDHKFHVLALDQKTHASLSGRTGDFLEVYSTDQVNEDFELRSLKHLQPSREAVSNATSSGKDPQHVQYCWALSSCFGNWLMEKYSCPLTYVDADLMFYSDMDDFFNELGDGSIGLVRHRIPYLYGSGEYNVGIVHFKSDGPGKSALRRWSQMMKNPQNSYSLGFGSCGDQKYLEIIQQIYRDDVVIVDENFGHLAPWNVTQHGYEDDRIVWQDRRQKLTYFHFAHFVLQEEGYRASYANEWIWGDPLKVGPFVRRLYDEYHESMRRNSMVNPK